MLATPDQVKRHAASGVLGIGRALMALCVGLVIGSAAAACNSGAGERPEAASSHRERSAEAAVPDPSATRRPSSRAEAIRCPRDGRTVRDAASLRRALAAVRPGDVIRLADGTYGGGFVIDGSGTQRKPIFLCGSRNAILDGLDDTDYVLHLNEAAWWRVIGFTVRNGRKGVIADRTRHTILSGLFVGSVGDEAIHLRTHSTDNLVVGNTIRDTGHRRGKFGEGVYVGSAQSNWCKYTDCEMDASDRNAIIGNDIADTTSEGIDIKEGTQSGVVADNAISGAGMTDADSWIDVKGSGWLIERNRGSDSPEDGIQTHVIVKGWGSRNLFRSNKLDVDGPGYGIYIHEEERSRNIVRCDNAVHGAANGLSNVPCRDG